MSPPAIELVPPLPDATSKSRTRAPACFASIAAEAPAEPKPTIATSASKSQRGTSARRQGRLGEWGLDIGGVLAAAGADPAAPHPATRRAAREAPRQPTPSASCIVAHGK